MTKTNEEETEIIDENPEVNFEPKDVNARALMRIGIGIIISAVIIQAVVWWLYDYLRKNRDVYKGRQSVTEIKATAPQPPQPRLQLSPAIDLQALENAQREQISNYGWVDQSNGIVKIPIERAMKLIEERGIATTVKSSATQGQTDQNATPATTDDKRKGSAAQSKEGRPK